MKFQKVYIEISNICNLQCQFCPEVLRPKKLMTSAFFRELIKKIKPHTRAVTLHLMGEPLAHPQFSEFLQVLEEEKVPLILTSNGVLIERHRETLLQFSQAQQINFSLHSFFDNYPERDIQPYIEKLVLFGRDYLSLFPDRFINFRLWNIARQDPRQTEANWEIYRVLKTLFEAPELPSTIQVKTQKSFRLERHFKLHFDTQFEWPSLNQPTRSTRGSCYGLQSQIAILADGTLVPCCLDKEAVINLGSLKTHTLEELLSSPRAQALLKGFQQNQLVEELCQKCDFRTRFNEA